MRDFSQHVSLLCICVHVKIFYRESYVRFCTKPFLLEDFHESIHLCNNAIQCRYQNSDQRDSNLPDENMWSSDTFQAYLKTVGRLDVNQ